MLLYVSDSSIYILPWDSSLEHHEHLNMLLLFWVTNSFLSLTPPGGLKDKEDCTDPCMTLLQHRWCTLNKFKEMRPIRVWLKISFLWESKKIMWVLSIDCWLINTSRWCRFIMASCLQGGDSLIKNSEVTWLVPQNLKRSLLHHHMSIAVGRLCK